MTLTASCGWCGTTFDPGVQPTCPRCGAPPGQGIESTHAGWIETPSLSPNTMLQMGRSQARIEGDQNPVLFCDLAEGDQISFGHRNLLWLDPTLRMDSVKTGSSAAAILTEVPWRQIVTTGPGRLGLAAGRAGELGVLPMDPGAAVHARPPALLAAAVGLGVELVPGPISFWEKDDDSTVQRFPMGRYVVRLTATTVPSVAFVVARGDLNIKRLEVDEPLLVNPASVAWYDASVRWRACVELLRGRQHAFYTGITGFALGNRSWVGPGTVLWAEAFGPGRLAISTAGFPASVPAARDRYMIDKRVTSELVWD
jgi:uncharacterized protein (AIM24 family)